MSPAVGLALLAGGLAAVGITELVSAQAARPRRRPRRAAALLRGLISLGRRIGVPLRAPADLQRSLDAAGVAHSLSVADLMAAKAGAAVVITAVGLPVATMLPGRLPLVAVPALPIAGFLAPDRLLKRRARRRAAAMELELPDVLDLLRVSVAAGLPLGRALAEVGRRHPGAVGRELHATANELELGVPREAALEGLARRCPTPEVRSLVATLDRAHRHGAPLSGVLAAQSEDVRATRARRVREQAARAAPKIQLVIALLLVPAVLLLVGAAMAAALVG